jgi:hypothetical protein
VVTGLRVWNYNKDWSSSFRGVRHAQIQIDGRKLQPGFTVFRKAAGIAGFDDYQTIALVPKPQEAAPASSAGLRPVRPAYDRPIVPFGLTLKLVLLSTWGDPHYIGLNGCNLQFVAVARLD